MIALDTLRAEHATRFGSAPTLASTAPGRVNLLGEHVDYLGGKVLPAAIDRGISVVARLEKGAVELRIFSLDFGETAIWTRADLDRPCPGGWQAYVWGSVKECLALGNPWLGGSVAFGGDVPKGAGLSSSAALEVAMCNLLLQAGGTRIGSKDLAKLARRVENVHVGTQCGIMDQFISVHGEAGCFLILDCASLEHKAVPARLPGCAWILVDSMVSHKLGADYNAIRAELESAGGKLAPDGRLIDVPEQALEAKRAGLTPSEFARARYAIGEVRRTDAFVAAMRATDLPQIGRLLVATHEGLSRDLRVSTAELDALVDAGRQVPGWLGGRMMGGGFGGCTINLVREEALAAFQDALARDFKKRFGLAPAFHPVRLGDGARVEKLS